MPARMTVSLISDHIFALAFWLGVTLIGLQGALS